MSNFPLKTNIRWNQVQRHIGIASYGLAPVRNTQEDKWKGGRYHILSYRTNNIRFFNKQALNRLTPTNKILLFNQVEPFHKKRLFSFPI
ncbi:hypothetical protein [uncultured Bartonella sp.]|uniref:hypothetical protein n=1 Tax=uncultured Bartonella sp. TaxID=104108 RepID=UPI0025E4B8B6|nr:hypothetical protein [uncultured Bartonella sp.]